MYNKPTDAVIRQQLHVLLSQPEYKVLLDVRAEFIEELKKRLMALDYKTPDFTEQYAYMRGQIDVFHVFDLMLQMKLDINK